jgi:hypothetical protein
MFVGSSSGYTTPLYHILLFLFLFIHSRWTLVATYIGPWKLPGAETVKGNGSESPGSLHLPLVTYVQRLVFLLDIKLPHAPRLEVANSKQSVS